MVQTHFRDQAISAEHSPDQGPQCSIAKGFFDFDVTSAIINFNFKHEPAIQVLTELSPASLSSWTFLRTLRRGSHEDKPVIPSDGLTAAELQQFIQNVAFVLHLFYDDSEHYDSITVPSPGGASLQAS